MSLIDNARKIVEDENETAQLQQAVALRAKQEKHRATAQDFLHKYFKEASASILVGVPTFKPGTYENRWRARTHVPLFGADEKSLKVAIKILGKNSGLEEEAYFAKRTFFVWQKIDALKAAKIIAKMVNV